METKLDLKKKSTISIEDETRIRLKGEGAMGDSYDSVINRILDEVQEYRRKAKK
jgi:hypothetical protein